MRMQGAGGKGEQVSAVKVKESDIQRLILDWLSANKIWHMRLNTGAMAGVHKGKKWFVRFGKPGMADIIAVKPLLAPYLPPICTAAAMTLPMTAFTVNVLAAGQPYPVPTYWIEVKAPKGVQSPDQKSFQSEVEAQGMKYILARSLEDVIEGLK